MLSTDWTPPSECLGGIGCPEVRQLYGKVQIRESNAPDQVVEMTMESWSRLVAATKRGEFDPQ